MGGKMKSIPRDRFFKSNKGAKYSKDDFFVILNSRTGEKR
jgi:hypothetical protein